MKFFLKLVISGGLISWVLIYKINWLDFRTIMQQTNIWLLIIAFLLHFSGFWFSALRWQKLLEMQGVKVKLWPLIDSYLVSSFFNIFMPTRIGGDVVRINDLKHTFNSITKSASSVVVERFLGISILFIFAFIASLYRLNLAQQIPAIWVGLGIGILGVALFLSVIYFDYITFFFRFVPSKKLREKLVSGYNNFRESTISLLSKKDALAWGLGYSFFLQVNVILHFWIIGIAMHFSIPLIDYFFLIPIQLVILMAPTINGLGLRETSSIVLFGYYGITATEATIFSLIDLFMLLIIGLIGWTRFISRRAPSLTFNKQYS